MKTTDKTRHSEHAMTKFMNLEDAERFMKMRNRAERLNRRPRFVVLVDGPEDDFFVMELSEAIDNEFLYRWSV